ncbi:MAG: metallophosphoesterase [Bacteroidia bacterium]|nr:metallophosphoesterase [Bacteroidia bacterium]
MTNINTLTTTFKQFAVFIVLVLMLFTTCNKFENNPFQIDSRERPSDLNAKNISQLLSAEAAADDTVTILFTGDSQRFYDRLDDLVQKANQFSNIDFLLLDGDISNYGLLQELLWVYERLEGLNIPYICVVGNHDLTSRGSEIYTGMFGPKNFTFTYKNYKFLCHDDNSREYGFPGSIPDLNWLSSELNNSSASWFVAASHIPPWNDDFDQTMVQDYVNLFSSKPGFILSLHGHLIAPYAPDIRYYNNDSIPYIVSSDVQRHECFLLKLIHGTIIKQLIEY